MKDEEHRERCRPAGRKAAEVFSVPFVDPVTGRTETARLATTYRCDQRCVMCDLHRLGGDLPDEAIEAAIARAARSGVGRLILTGGEPALDPRLPALVRRARAVGIGLVELQTNAVPLADGEAAAALAEAGLGRALVSLHSADALVSDAITRAPGTHAQTLRGIDRLLEAGVVVHLNAVILRTNVDGLEDLVLLVARRWAAREGFGELHLHTARADVDDPVRWRRIVPSLRVVGPRLRAALDQCHRLGVRFSGPGSAMGVPYCVLDGDPRYLGPLAGPGASRRHRAEQAMFTRLEVCEGCRLRGRCPGVRRDYVALYGAEGLTRLR